MSGRILVKTYYVFSKHNPATFVRGSKRTFFTNKEVVENVGRNKKLT